jgi:hypothetical protein
MAMITCSDVTLLALDLGKATFDNAYDSIVTLQQKVEEGTLALAHDSPWLPHELRAVLKEWIGLSRRTRKDLRGTVDRCYVLLRALAEGEGEESGAAPAPRRHAPSRNLRAA